MRVAIVHDWLYGGGAERVVLELHRMFPDAPIYTSYCSDEWRKKLDNKVITGYLQHWPFRNLRKFLPVLRQRWFRKLDLSGFDLVISSSGNGEAKFVRAKKPAIHICYCHTPTHFYWRHFDEYLKNPGIRPKWLARAGLKLLVKPLRQRDYKAAQKIDYFVANSSHIQNDIKKFYGRDSEIIHPPVDIERFKSVKEPGQRRGFVTMGRQVPMKKIDLIIEACKNLKLPLTIIGNGPEHSRLVQMTGPTIHFKTDISDADMPSELASAEAFIFASFEDFGIAPIEAMATGTPIIAYRAGGALDYIIPGKTGEFFTEQTAESLQETLENFNPRMFDSKQIIKQSEIFSSDIFCDKLQRFIEKTLK